MMNGSNELPPGFRLEEFEIKSVLGSGGFGVTYLGWDHNLAQYVAIKEYFARDWSQRLPDGSVASISPRAEEDFLWGRNFFIEEARTMNKLRHPNIVRATRYIGNEESGYNGTGYIIMDYIEGEDFQTYLKREKTLPANDVRYMLELLLDGLRDAHDLKIVHRDIKPENILISTEKGQPVLIDFGAAREIVQSRSRPVTAFVTPPYAPHEQYTTQSKKQGAWTDLYSLSAVGYVALSGKMLPDGTSRLDEDTFEPLDENAYGDAPLCRAINKGLAVKTKDRPGSIDAWLDISGCHHVERMRIDGRDKVQDDENDAAGGGTVIRPRNGDTIKRPPLPVEGSGAEGSFGIPRWVYLGLAGVTLAVIALNLAPIFTPGTIIVGGEDESKPAFRANRSVSSLPKMVGIPAGSFEVGGKNVTIPRAFRISDSEVTIGQWQACARAGKCEDLSRVTVRGVDEKITTLDVTKVNEPVRNVNYSWIQGYLSWLSEETGDSYRLPTEAEWEYAARAGKNTKWSWGNSPATGRANCADCGTGFSAPRVQDVKSYNKNAFGVYDMEGNVWELVSDCWTENFSSQGGDGSVASQGNCPSKVVRGGGYRQTQENVHLSSRTGFTTIVNNVEQSNRELGFRIVTD